MVKRVRGIHGFSMSPGSEPLFRAFALAFPLCSIRIEAFHAGHCTALRRHPVTINSSSPIFGNQQTSHGFGEGHGYPCSRLSSAQDKATGALASWKKRTLDFKRNNDGRIRNPVSTSTISAKGNLKCTPRPRAIPIFDS